MDMKDITRDYGWTEKTGQQQSELSGSNQALINQQEEKKW